MELTDTGHWTATVPYEEGAIGFVYIITNLADGRKYIGKKGMLSKVCKPPLKGTKRKRRSVKESDWKTYTSSSEEINADLLRLGKENFKFEIVRWCDSKSSMAYFEAKLQFETDAILKPKEYYNGICNLRIGRNCFKNSKLLQKNESTADNQMQGHQV